MNSSGKSKKRVVFLPQVREHEGSASYIARSIANARNGCYEGTRLKIDQGYGDYNMNLFRLKAKRHYQRDIPSAFSSSLKSLLTEHSKSLITEHPKSLITDHSKSLITEHPKSEAHRRIATEHNQKISQIIAAPKEVYLEQIRVEREEKARLEQLERERNKYVKGFEEEVREINEQLSFQYLPPHQASNWFKLKDNSSNYAPPHFLPPSRDYLTTPKARPKRRKGFIFQSDHVRKAAQLRPL